MPSARPPFVSLLIERARDPYRPERHYMRGPGPKWHARHRAIIAGVAL